MKELKPLLQDEEEKFYFLENKPSKKLNIKFSKENITTSIISIIVLWLMWYSFYPFYIGFVNYDKYHTNTIETTNP